MICAACHASTDADPCVACGAAPLLAGRYRLERILGQGAAGTTWRAIAADGGTVAIKELPLRAGELDRTRERFEREVRVLRTLAHPGVPRWIEDFTDGAGRSRALFLVMEHVDGEDLAHELTHHRYTEAEVVDVMVGVLDVLVYLHGLAPPVIHRDIKPRNVMRRREDRRLVLVDFGAVRDVLRDPELGGSTVAGTFGYMAPEQFQGDASPATDLYGVGALAIALLSRKEAHTLLDVGGRLRWEPHVSVSPGLHRVLTRLLARDPAQRPRSAAEVLRELRGGVALERSRPQPDVEVGPRPVIVREPPAVDPLAPPPLPQPLARVERPIPFVGRSRPGPRAAMVVSYLLFFFALGGIYLFSRGSAAPVADPIAATCTIKLHDTSGLLPLDNTNGYEILRTNAAGDRAAVAYTLPGGRAHVMGYQAGVREPLFDVKLEKWESARTGATVDLAPAAEKLAASGLDAEPALAAARWCQAGDRVDIEGRGYTWKTVEEACDRGGVSVQWELCDGSGECVRAPDPGGACWPGRPRLVDVYVNEGWMWVVAERDMGIGTARMVAGGRW